MNRLLQKIIHWPQDRRFPRTVFAVLAAAFGSWEFPVRRGGEDNVVAPLVISAI